MYEYVFIFTATAGDELSLVVCTGSKHADIPASSRVGVTLKMAHIT